MKFIEIIASEKKGLKKLEEYGFVFDWAHNSSVRSQVIAEDVNA